MNAGLTSSSVIRQSRPSTSTFWTGSTSWSSCELTGDGSSSPSMSHAAWLEDTRMTANIQYSFDREADVLYLSGGEPSADAESEEIGDDIVIHHDRATGDVVGFTILNFLKRAGEGLDKVT